MATSKQPPFSEDTHKKTDASKEECIDELKRIALENPELVITRNYFRNHAKISESAWNKHFGKFSEFKRAAGVMLTRHQARLELQIAKHASSIEYERLTKEKMEWNGKYKKPQGDRFQTIVICSDVHDVECDPFWRRTFIDSVKRIQPAKIIFNGDIFDLPEFGRYTVDPREWDVVERIQWVHKFLEELRNICPDAEFVFIEGNHEFRLFRHLSESTPALKAVLSDLLDYNIPKLLGIDKYEINFIGQANLKAFRESDIKKELSRNYWIGYDCILGHHFPEGRNLGYPGWNGHHHKHICYPEFSPRYGPYEWHQLGCGHKRQATFCDGEKWHTGFMIAHIDTQKLLTQFEYVHVQDHAVIGGKWYIRNEDEEY